MDNAISWPKKTRELHNHHFDSTIWNDFAFRDDDIILYLREGDPQLRWWEEFALL